MKIKEIKIVNQDESTEIADIGADAVNVDYNDTTVKAELDKLNTVDDSIMNMQANQRATLNNLELAVSNLASGSPKGAYTSATALKTANPDTGVYIVTENGHIYSWTKNQSGDPIDLGVYQAAEDSETVEQLSKDVNEIKSLYEKEMTGNILTVDLIEPRTIYTNTDGVAVKSVMDGFTTVIFEVKPNEYYSINTLSSGLSGNRSFAVTENMEIINTQLNALKVVNGVYKMPANAKYICLTYITSNMEANGIVVVKGYDTNIYDSNIESYPYGGEIKTISIPKLDLNEQVDELNLKINQIEPQMTTFFEVNKPRNLFNKNSEEIIDGKYLTSGGEANNENYFISHYIDVKEFDYVTISGIIMSGSYIVFYDNNKNIVNSYGTISGNEYTAKVYEGSKYMRFSGQKAYNINTAQVEEGQTASPYSPYFETTYKIPKTYIEEDESVTSYVITVSPYGDKDFETINEAYTYALTLESKDTPVTILLYPGTYKEVLLANRTHYISFIGVNKKDVIWRDDTGLYANAPLRYCGCGLIKGISFIATHKDDPNFENTTDKDSTTIGSYALHIDNAWDDEEATILVEDCYCYSEQNASCGIGMYDNKTLIFKDCVFETNMGPGMQGGTHSDKGSWLIHKRLNITGSVPQKCILDNCRLYKNFGYVMQTGRAFTPEDDGFEMSFYNNILWSGTKGKTNVVQINSGTVFNSDSFGNNTDELNA